MSSDHAQPDLPPATASRRRMALLALAAALGIMVFLVAAAMVAGGGLQAADEAFLLSLRDGIRPELPRGPDWVVRFMLGVTTMGNAWFFTLVVTAAVAYLAWRREYRTMWLLILVALGGWAVLTGLKEVFARPRPVVVPRLIEISEYSFPSGHAMMSAAIYVSLAAMAARRLRHRVARVTLVVAAVLLSVIIGFSRAFLGVHYPSDIAAGWAAGLAWACLCWLTASWPRRTASVEE